VGLRASEWLRTRGAQVACDDLMESRNTTSQMKCCHGSTTRPSRVSSTGRVVATAMRMRGRVAVDNTGERRVARPVVSKVAAI